MRVIAADVGGTKTLLQIADWNNHAWVIGKKTEYRSTDFPNFESMIKQFIEGETSVETACFAIAGPVDNFGDYQTAKVTNLPWQIDSRVLQKQFGFRATRLINDFQAVGYGIPELSAHEIVSLQNGAPQMNSVSAIIGAGTGLGQAFVIPGTPIQVVGTEGGHIDFAPNDEEQVMLWQFLSKRYSHVSYERIVSGPGICNLYEFYAQQNPDQAQSELLIACQQSDTAAISNAAEQGDPLATATLTLFFRIYGAQAGNWALSTLPRGGLYIAGGIAVKLKKHFANGEFMQSFLAKGRMQSVLEKIPVHIILQPQIGLLGCLYVARSCGSNS